MNTTRKSTNSKAKAVAKCHICLGAEGQECRGVKGFSCLRSQFRVLLTVRDGENEDLVVEPSAPSDTANVKVEDVLEQKQKGFIEEEHIEDLDLPITSKDSA